MRIPGGFLSLQMAEAMKCDALKSGNFLSCQFGCRDPLCFYAFQSFLFCIVRYSIPTISSESGPSSWDCGSINIPAIL